MERLRGWTLRIEGHTWGDERVESPWDTHRRLERAFSNQNGFPAGWSGRCLHDWTAMEASGFARIR